MRKGKGEEGSVLDVIGMWSARQQKDILITDICDVSIEEENTCFCDDLA